MNPTFDKCVIRSCGGRSIRCVLGLWSVSAKDKETAEGQAIIRWQRYYAEGEYQKHLCSAADLQPTFSMRSKSELLAACGVIAAECKRVEESGVTENEKLWLRAYASGARRLVHDLMGASPTGLGVITNCPVCGSKELKDESALLVEGVSCKSCGWADMDGGVDSGC